MTLRSAIQAANATPGGNTINLTVPGTYKITIPGAGDDANATGDFDILPSSGSLSIINTSGGVIMVDANHLDRAFDINPGFNPSNPTPAFAVTMQGFTIQNGYATNAANPDGPNASGGGIRVDGNASLTLTNMTVTGNSASADGGGVSMENVLSAPWSLTLNNSTVSSNYAGDAGGGIESDGSGAIAVNPGSVITANSALNQGGGIWLDAIQVGTVFQSANLTMSGAIVSDNASLTSAAGGIGNAGNGTGAIISSTIAGNRSAAQGGGVADLNAQARWTINKALVSNNYSATNGGGIASTSPNLAITSSQFQNNQAGGAGGGVFADGTTANLTDCTFTRNVAGVSGGAAEIETFGTGALGSSISESTLSDNTAVNSFSPATGGGIGAAGGLSGTLTLLNDTITGNIADQGGGVFWTGASGSSVRIQNTVIAANHANPTGPDVANPAGSITDLGGNLIGVAGPGSGNLGFSSSTTIAGAPALPYDPQLGPLANNNGPLAGDPTNAVTLLTRAPLSGSALIGHGVVTDAPPTDERGFVNVVGGLVNIGAVSNGAASITGVVFNDLNNSAVRDSSEPGLAGVVVYLDSNNNGKLDPGEPSVTTDAAGNFSFANLFPGQLVVRQVILPGYAGTAPVGAVQNLSASAGSTASGVTFGDVLVSSVTMNLPYFLTLCRNFGRPGTFADGDVNGDGTVNLADLLLVTRNFGHPLPTPAIAGIAQGSKPASPTIARRRIG